jgi:hypothetical protein
VQRGAEGWEFRVQSWEVRRGFEDESTSNKSEFLVVYKLQGSDDRTSSDRDLPEVAFESAKRLAEEWREEHA